MFFGVVKSGVVTGPVTHAEGVVEHQHDGAGHAAAPPICRLRRDDRSGCGEDEQRKNQTAQQQEEQVFDAGPARGFRLHQLEKAQRAERDLHDALALQEMNDDRQGQCRQPD